MRVYPRACGATVNPRLTSSTAWGLSPRMRGNRDQGRPRSIGKGSIPAHAGQPVTDSDSRSRRRVYPRACGATEIRKHGLTLTQGLSPRMRGNHQSTQARSYAGGSIPAHAGQPLVVDGDAEDAGVYPRACGATAMGFMLALSEKGLSPRMRGNLRQIIRRAGVRGSIPAHAGQPSIAGDIMHYYKVYPRACGATLRCSHSFAIVRVYPRACGATLGRTGSDGVEGGLSPRMRGNPPDYETGELTAGSIPAHAGQPSSSASIRARFRVYPRACGATWERASFPEQATGLSPRMRGNRRQARRAGAGRGSIPAHAGQPKSNGRCIVRPGVYPRACGATFMSSNSVLDFQGLSPRMRGNRGRQ